MWLAAIGGCLWWQFGYETTPGPSGQSTVRPVALAAEPGRSQIVMALHPQCPCTRATLAELEVALRKLPSPDVVLLTATYGDRTWLSSDMCRKARAIPNMRIVEDFQGRLAATLGMHTSGHIVAYNGDGDLVFSGGITFGRGVPGSNDGLAALLAALSLNTNASQGGMVPGYKVPTYPVFGCSLDNGECVIGCGEGRP